MWALLSFGMPSSCDKSMFAGRKKTSWRKKGCKKHQSLIDFARSLRVLPGEVSAVVNSVEGCGSRGMGRLEISYRNGELRKRGKNRVRRQRARWPAINKLRLEFACCRQVQKTLPLILLHQQLPQELKTPGSLTAGRQVDQIQVCAD